MAREEYDWIDDAFADEKGSDRAPSHVRTEKASAEYDWIDDAFDEGKPDPLAKKGMTGCSSFAVAFCVIVTLALLAFVAFLLANSWSVLQASMA